MERERWLQLISEGRVAAASLPPGSPTRAVASDEWFAQLEDEEPPYGNSAPPLLLHLCRKDHDDLLAFDRDLERVQASMPQEGSRQDFLAFGREHGVEADRQWVAGLVELGLQTRLLRQLGPDRALLSPRLPGGGHADVLIDLGSRRVWIEISVLSDGRDAVQAFDPAASVQSSWGDPYADAGRVYSKVFSKAVGSGSPARGQLHASEPSLVIVGDVAWRSPGFASLGYSWALGQLTDPARRNDELYASLNRWLEGAFGDEADRALASLSALSAVGVVSTDLTLLDLRPNQSADDAHRLTSDEIEALRRLLDGDPSIAET